MLTVRDINVDSIEDVFKVCSHNKLTDPLQLKGIEMRRKWLKAMLKEHGRCVKVAYLDDRPIAQIMFYTENGVPFIDNPREGVVLLRCVYNPFPEARGKGAATALISSLIKDCQEGTGFLKGKKCSFIAADVFNTGEGIPMEKLYENCGFSKHLDEMTYMVSGQYSAPTKPVYKALEEDRGKAVTFYNPTCEYSYPFAVRVRSFLKELKPDLKVDLIDQWEHPTESRRRGNHWLIINSKPMKKTWFEREDLKQEVLEALTDEFGSIVHE